MSDFVWSYGKVHTLPLYTHRVVEKINTLIGDSGSEWIFFWDSSLGSPNVTLVQELCNAKIDCWHAGLKLGMSGLPEALNYIDPAWVYNKDAQPDIISSSFRLSLRACLVRTSILSAVGGLQEIYWSLDALSLALGYAIIKKGGIIRHHPHLVTITEKQHTLPWHDEWVFTRQFFSKKWQLWVLFNKPAFKINYKYWRRIKHVKTQTLRPSIHSSQVYEAVDVQTKVSVLAPTLDRYPYLNKELEQLAEQTVLPLEVLITDQTDEARRQPIDTSLYPKLNIRYFPQNEKGQCIAWNKLLQEAQGDYVLFLGDDADNIKPDFIEKLMSTAERYNADMVASNVIELKAPKREINYHYYMSDTFPITLVKRKLVLDAGMMDMFFNKNIRADYDLALRCHELGALMVFDSSALIDHHRAPSGGLRAHKARTITNAMSKSSVSKFAEPTASELFLVKRHFSQEQFKMFVRIKYFEQLAVKGNIFKKLLRLLVFLFKWPAMQKRYRQRLSEADAELRLRGFLVS